MKQLLSSVALAVLVTSAHSQQIEGVVVPVKKVTVSSPALQDVITSMPVKEGDTVKEGDLLAQLNASREELVLERAQKQLEFAEGKAETALSLFKNSTGRGEKVVEETENLELANIRHREAQAALKERTIRSPLSGIVVKKHKEAGESVDRVEMLVEVANIDQVYVQFHLDPKLMQTIALEQPLQVRFPLLAGAEEFTGKVSFIDPQIDTASGLTKIKVLVENPDHRIKAGMRGSVDFGKLAAR